jgi:hypothetical protein
MTVSPIPKTDHPKAKSAEVIAMALAQRSLSSSVRNGRHMVGARCRAALGARSHPQNEIRRLVRQRQVVFRFHLNPWGRNYADR